MNFPWPKWIESMPAGEVRTRAEHRFVLRLCCLYAHPHGRIHNLAKLIGVKSTTLRTQIQSNRGLASKKTRAGIERILGAEFVPPDIADANAPQSPVHERKA